MKPELAMDSSETTAAITAPRISSDTKLAQVMALHPNVLEYIIWLGSHDFERLRQAVMDKLMSPHYFKHLTAGRARPVLARINHANDDDSHFW